MHKPFLEYIQNWKNIALAKGLDWEFKLNEKGISDSGWNLTAIVNGIAPPVHYLRNLGGDDKGIAFINKERPAGDKLLQKTALDKHWQELIKASTVEHLFYKRSTTSYISSGAVRPLKLLGTYCTYQSIKPWELTPEIVDKVVIIAQKIQPSNHLSNNIIGITKTLFDKNHLTINSPIHSSLLSQRVSKNDYRRSNHTKSNVDLLDDLLQRKSQSKLPEQKAFWELLRIIFTEKPSSYSDAVRFAMIKILLFTGFRVGEAVRLPADWKRIREYFDANGKSAGQFGGYSSALLLRHFAEKQQSEMSDSVALYENTQYVPDMFKDILTETLDEMVKITQPLRDTLKLQCETGRILPWYDRKQNVPVTEIYTRLTGNPFLLKLGKGESNKYISKYNENFNPAIFTQIRNYQKLIYNLEGGSTFDNGFYIFFNRLVAEKSINFIHANGSKYQESRFKWNEVYLNIGELEDYLKINLPTKLSDTKPIKLSDGELQPWELLFLIPKRAKKQMDLSSYYSVGIPDTSFLITYLGDDKSRDNLFIRYGQTIEDKSLYLTSHSLRHLQNTELFRLGVADTIITKRFNRRSVAQSYVYDHRSLAESLESIELPIEVEALLGEKSLTVAKMIKSGIASGPIVDEFKKIEKEHGELVAFEYLKVEADGFHATPYGHCINSFTVDPCPKHLECFAGCRHLTATNLPHQMNNLRNLERKFEVAIAEIQARPATTIGHENQIEHATVRLESIRKLLQTPTGQPVFPDGEDFSKTNSPRSVI